MVPGSESADAAEAGRFRQAGIPASAQRVSPILVRELKA